MRLNFYALRKFPYIVMVRKISHRLF